MSPESEVYEFKFHFLNSDGQATSMFRKKGRFVAGTLVLNDMEIPAGMIIQAQTFENRMAISYPSSEGDFATILIQPSSKSVTNQLKKHIDIARSRTWADNNRKQLEEAGRGNDYRESICPHCHATLLLSDMPITSQVYCHYCDSLTTVDQQPPKGEPKLKLCDECQMYSQPQVYSVFYFVFLIAAYWYSSGTARKCRACMRSDAWKMFFGNFLFILGLPNAIYQLVRSYSGGALVEGDFAGLNKANIAARKQNWSAATGGYGQVLQSVGVSAGIKYNMGLALRAAGNQEQAAQSLELALADCSNYAPAYHHLSDIYQATGQVEKLKLLKQQWEDAEEESQQEPIEYQSQDPAALPES